MYYNRKCVGVRVMFGEWIDEYNVAGRWVIEDGNHELRWGSS